MQWSLIVYCDVLGDGNVAPKMAIPIYMIFPRLFTCPTLATKVHETCCRT